MPQDFCKYGPLWDKHPTETAEAPIPEGETKLAPVKLSAPKVVSSTGVINIKIAPRVGRRYLTAISGLEQCDVDLAKAVKIFSKKFACGVSKDDTGAIEIQGDCEETIIDVITSNWKQIKPKQIVIKRK